MRRGCVLLLVVLLSGCAPVQQQSVLTTPVGRSLVAGVGDTVLRVEGKESLPNIAGHADIFGRTRPTGLTTIQYGGLQGNKAILLCNDVVIQSNATTLNTRVSIAPTEQQTSISNVVGSAPTSGTVATGRTAHIRRVPLVTVSSPQPTIPVLVDWRVDPRVPMLGQTIVIEAANSTSLTYHVE
jgi:hypothetical protein